MRMRIAAVVAGLALGLALPARSAETYGLLFPEGVLADMAEGEVLSYAVRRAGRAAPMRAGEAAGGSPAELRLDLTAAAADELVMTVTQGETTQRAGTFPASVGNPLIMYFLETVLRDMADQAGGSPFYIRNRIKEALLREADIQPFALALDGRALAAREITLHPFATDAARDRMSGFADLTLVAVVSEEVPGRYYSLTATAPAPSGEAGAGYSNAITLLPGATE